MEAIEVSEEVAVVAVGVLASWAGRGRARILGHRGRGFLDVFAWSLHIIRGSDPFFVPCSAHRRVVCPHLNSEEPLFMIRQLKPGAGIRAVFATRHSDDESMYEAHEANWDD
ncbi:hypothetical protein GCM10027061_15410 [Nesterenkonia suensis]